MFTVLERMIRAYQAFRPKGRPTWAKVFLNTDCNLRCAYCSVPKQRSRELGLEEWKVMYKGLKELRIFFVSILGGEPTLRTDLARHVRAIRDLGMEVSLTTNAVKLDSDGLEKLTKAGLTGLQISADGLDLPSTRKGLTEHKLELLEQARNSRVLPIVTSVLTSQNADSIVELAKRVTGMGYFFSFSMYQSLGGYFSRKDSNLVPEASRFRSAIEGLREIKRTSGRVINTYEYLDRARGGEFGWRCRPDQDLWVGIDSEGHLMRCHEHKSEFRAGPTIDLESESWREFRETAVAGCSGCSYHCYFDAEVASLLAIAREARTYANVLKDKLAG